MDQPLPSTGRAIYICRDGRLNPTYRWDRQRPTALLPGAFNPIHAGHRALADTAAEILGLPVALELSIANVDKPLLAADEVQRRLLPLAGEAAVWLTHAPRFVDKAELFPGAVFVVGADTALRLVDPRYYEDDPARVPQALEHLRAHGCRFLVACRVDGAGRCVELADVPAPAGWREMFTAIPAQRFRLDLSSTEIRLRGAGGV
jgi:hypothetical protein